MTEQFDLLSMLEEEHEKGAARGVERVGQNALASVSSAARAVRLQQQRIEQLKAETKEAEEELRRLTDDVLPSLFAELQLQSFKLEDGSEITVRQTYSASPSVENRPKVYEWLRDNGFGDIIKNTVFCTFGRDEDEKARQFYATVEQAGLVAEAKTEVHPMTLRAFVRERVEAGEEFPMELFGAWVGQRATITTGGK